ncbi:MAG TPA: PKD domain-containing protein [Solirubrobacteraceae bacterium]|jgi:hypothetical protein|nr:PKD domain-containing protein [Solirubrobacteraceae bacterium]
MTRKHRRRALLAAGIAVGALALPAAAAQAATYTVAKGGGTCGGADLSCESLVAAAGAVNPGDVVEVSPGTYDEAPTFTDAGVTINGATDPPGVIVTGTISFSGSGATPSVLSHVIVAPSTLTSPAVGVSGTAGVAVRDSFLLSGGASAMTISNGAGNEITRSTLLSGAPDGKAVDVQVATAPVSLFLSSSILAGGGSGYGLAVKTGVGTLLPGSAGAATVTAKHITIAGSANAISLDSSSATGLLNQSAGNITANVSDSIVLGANPRANSAGIPLVAAANTATLNFTRTDQTSSPDLLFANAAKRNYHLRPDSPAIDKGQITSGDSATDIDGQPRDNGTGSDLGADEFVNSVPTASFVVATPNPRSNQPVTFDASGSTDREGGIGGGIVQYQWNFGDGTTESTTTPTVAHTYPKDGTVVVQLVVIDRQAGASPPFVAPVKLTDGTPPTVVITRPKANQKLALTKKTTKTVTKNGKKTKKTTTKRVRIGFAGTAKDASGVAAVFLTLERISVAPKKKKTTTARSAATPAAPKVVKRCVWLDPKTGFVSRPCDKPVLIRTGTRQGAWAYNIATRIKPVAGTYRLSVYGSDAAGAFGNSAPAKSRVVRFTLTG